MATAHYFVCLLQKMGGLPEFGFLSKEPNLENRFVGRLRLMAQNQNIQIRYTQAIERKAKEIASGDTLPIANGGTNSTATATAGGAVYGTGTALAVTAAGTSGYILQSTGASAPVWSAPSGGGYQIASFASSGTWTCPAGVTRAKINVVGGGGGATNNGCHDGGAGGGGWNYFTVTPGTVYTITIGAGGAANTVNGVGTPGGSTSVGSLITATGGSGGTSTDNGAPGSCANSFGFTGSANLNGLVMYGICTMAIGNSNATTAAVAYSFNSIETPGGAGNGNVPAGGRGGCAVIQYIG
jgi:hypothetical protein